MIQLSDPARRETVSPPVSTWNLVSRSHGVGIVVGCACALTVLLGLTAQAQTFDLLVPGPMTFISRSKEELQVGAGARAWTYSRSAVRVWEWSRVSELDDKEVLTLSSGGTVRWALTAESIVPVSTDGGKGQTLSLVRSELEDPTWERARSCLSLEPAGSGPLPARHELLPLGEDFLVVGRLCTVRVSRSKPTLMVGEGSWPTTLVLAGSEAVSTRRRGREIVAVSEESDGVFPKYLLPGGHEVHRFEPVRGGLLVLTKRTSEKLLPGPAFLCSTASPSWSCEPVGARTKGSSTGTQDASFNHVPLQHVAVTESRVVGVTPDEIYVQSQGDPVLWDPSDAHLPHPARAVAAAAELVVLMDRTRLVWLDPTTGAIERTVEHGFEGSAEVLPQERGLLVVASEKLYRLNDAERLEVRAEKVWWGFLCWTWWSCGSKLEIAYSGAAVRDLGSEAPGGFKAAVANSREELDDRPLDDATNQRFDLRPFRVNWIRAVDERGSARVVRVWFVPLSLIGSALVVLFFPVRKAPGPEGEKRGRQAMVVAVLASAVGVSADVLRSLESAARDRASRWKARRGR